MMRRRLEFLANVVFFLTLALMFYFGVKYLLPLALPFIAAFAIAALLRRPTVRLTKRFSRLPPKLTAALVLAVFFATVGTAAALLISALVGEMVDFAADVPQFISQLADGLGGENDVMSGLTDRLPPWLARYVNELYTRFSADVPGFLLSAAESLSSPLINTFGAIGSFAMKLPSVLVVLLVVIVSAFFIGTDYDGMRSALAELLPQRLRTHIRRIRSCSADTVVSLLKTYAFLMLLTFTELAVGLALINLCGGKIAHVVPVALLTALVDILPVLGVGTVLIPWALYDLAAGNSARALMLLGLYAVIVVIRNFLEPRLVGQRFGLHPVLTLFCIYIGGKLFGFTGIFLLPLTAIILKRLKDAGTFAYGSETCRFVNDALHIRERKQDLLR